jgi:hypothetical protein
MAPPLDFWSLIPYFGLVWIAANEAYSDDLGTGSR